MGMGNPENEIVCQCNVVLALHAVRMGMGNPENEIVCQCNRK
jgi:hypothetical protein